MYILVGIAVFVSSLLTGTVVSAFRAPERIRRPRPERPYAL